MSGCVREHAPWKVKDGTQAYTDRHASTLPSHGGVFIWTKSNISASLFTSRLIHHLHSSIEGGRAGAVVSLCVCVRVCMCSWVYVWWGGGMGVRVNDQPNHKYTGSQHPNKAGNLHSIAFLSGDRPAVNNNTRPSVVKRGARSDRHSWGEGAATGSFSLLSFPWH